MVIDTPAQFRSKAARQDSTTSPYVFLEDFTKINGLDSVSENSARDLARHKVLMAQIMFDRDGGNNLVNALINDAVYLEIKALELSGNENVGFTDDDLEKLSEITYLFGGTGECHDGSDFSNHIQGRTMDLLMDMEESLDNEAAHAISGNLENGRNTNYSGTYKTEAAESLKSKHKNLEEDKIKIASILYMSEKLFLGHDRSFDHDS